MQPRFNRNRRALPSTPRKVPGLNYCPAAFYDLSDGFGSIQPMKACKCVETIQFKSANLEFPDAVMEIAAGATATAEGNLRIDQVAGADIATGFKMFIPGGLHQIVTAEGYQLSQTAVRFVVSA